MYKTGLLLLSSFLIGCTAVNSVNSDTKALILPTVKEYSRPFQRELAGEIKACPASNSIVVVLNDYDKMMQETRIARGE